MQSTIGVGSKWVAFAARGRRDAYVYTVLGVTERGVYLNCPGSRSTGHLHSEAEFRKLFTVAPESL